MDQKAMASEEPKLAFYDNVEDLGTGSFGTVSLYRLKEEHMLSGHFPKVIAVKKLLKKGIAELREGNVSALIHKNIIHCYGVEVINAVTNIKMEVARCSLLKLQKDNFEEAIKDSDFLHLALQMAEGLEYLHAQDIAHRDIKPDNILALWPDYITDVKNSIFCVTLKLCDFGLSRHVPEDAVTMSIVGTPTYLAPELIAAYITKREFRGNYKMVDVFCLGLVFHQLLFKYLPEQREGVLYGKHSLISETTSQSDREEFVGLLRLMLAWESRERISARCVVNVIKPWFNETLLQQSLHKLQMELDIKQQEVNKIMFKMTEQQNTITLLQDQLQQVHPLKQSVSQQDKPKPLFDISEAGVTYKTQPDLHFYKKSELLGSGQFWSTWIFRLRKCPGIVFQNSEIPLAVVVKAISTKYWNEAEHRAPESKIPIKQKNILSFYKEENIRGMVYLQMELSKMNLYQLRMQLEGKFTMTEFESLGKQISDGLLHLHSVGIIHGRIKPQNILVMPGFIEGDVVHNFNLKISDHLLGCFIDTPTINEYMAPELARGEAAESFNTKKSADTFSMGVVFFEMLTGKLPFSLEQLEDACNDYTTWSLSWRNCSEQNTCMLYMFMTMLHVNYRQRMIFWTRSIRKWTALEKVKPMATAAYMGRLSGLDDMRALHRAAEVGDLEEAKWLLDSGDDVNRSDGKGWTPLHYACCSVQFAMVRLLVDRGADVNRANHSGNEPLLWACKSSKTDIAALLLENGADKDRLNQKGQRPLDVVSPRNREKYTQLFSRF